MQNFRGLGRREFLKLISLTPIGIFSRPLSGLTKNIADPQKKNIIILVFDAWSQHHVSMDGYPRNTMPNLEAFAANATIYHNHYSTGTFTVPGTSSMLTGMHPWSHRAFQLGGGLLEAHSGHTIFNMVASTHSTLAFTQNKFADQILRQAEPDLDEHIERWTFNTQARNLYDARLTSKDARLAFASFDDNIFQKDEGYDGSLFLGPLYRLFTLLNRRQNNERSKNLYPRGLPDSSEFFMLPDVVDGAIGLLKDIEQPSLAYLHFFPPHEPYSPTREFFGSFSDGWMPQQKPIHALSEKSLGAPKLQEHRQYYDEFLASWDAEVERLFEYLKQSGLTENSYIFITSDHGELFERGELGHWTKTIYDPLIHVPLMILQPGQAQRRDIHTMTSSLDLMPTIASLTANPIPEWAQGTLLPGLGGVEAEHRSFFAMDAKMNSSFAPLRNYVMSLTRDGHRLVRYSYPKEHYESYEFYDLDTDPEEMRDLYRDHPSLALKMRAELREKIDEVNRPYRREDVTGDSRYNSRS